MGCKWQLAAICLGLEYHVVGNIDYDNQELGCEICCLEAFRIWLEEQTSETTWKKLIEALRFAERNEVADLLEKLLDGEISVY